MKQFISIIAPWLVLALNTVVAQDLTQEAFNRYVGSSAYTFKSEEPGQLVMDHVWGDIEISGEPTDRVEIEETLTIRTKSEETAKRLFEDSKASVRQTSAEHEPLAVHVAGVSSKKRGVSFRYAVKLPDVFSVLIHTRGGDILAEHVKGEIDVSTSGGDMELIRLSGKISASTSGGDVQAVDLSGRVFVSTSGGDIDVEEVRGELGAKTSGGDIRVEEVQGSVSVSTSGGDLDLIHIDGREISARTSGGDITAENVSGTIDLTTSGGNIDMEHIDGDVEASTSGGDIDMEDMLGGVKVWTSGGSIIGEGILGAVDARTSAGDIQITKIWDQRLEDHDIDLKASAGDIEVTLPRDFPATFSVRANSPAVRPGEAIMSDFPLMITATRAVARAKGTTGEGTYEVKLETSIGTITISRED